MANNVIDGVDTTSNVASPIRSTGGALHVSNVAVEPGHDSTLDRTWGGGKATHTAAITSDTQVKSSAGVYYGYIVTTATATAAISIYDNTAESGTVIDVIPASTAVGKYISPVAITCAQGIYAGYAASATGTIIVLYG